jgi:hypothetical protein
VSTAGAVEGVGVMVGLLRIVIVQLAFAEW